MIEVMVSALVAVTITGAVIGLLNSSGRAGAEERHRAQAFSIAQEDQARLRSMRLSELGVAAKPRTVSLGGTNYTVTSGATFVTNKTGTPSCAAGTASADYVKISTVVSWPTVGSKDPAEIQSILSPVSGSLDPTHGTLAVNVKNEANTPISGVSLSGTGSGTFSGSTDSSGCALFVAPAGNYTLTPTLGAGYVNYDGETPPAKTTSIISGGTNTLELQYDKAGEIEVSFKTKNYSGAEIASSADEIIVSNARMTSAKTFGTPGGTRMPEFEAGSLYPFSGADTVYAGACSTNNPGTGGAVANVVVPVGGAVKAPLQLPPLLLTVKDTVAGKAVSGAPVTVTDSKCSVSGTAVKRTYTTNSAGQLNEPGLPWSTYSVCASAPITVEVKKNKFETLTRHETKSVEVHSTSGTALEVPISGSSPTGGCP